MSLRVGAPGLARRAVLPDQISAVQDSSKLRGLITPYIGQKIKVVCLTRDGNEVTHPENLLTDVYVERGLDVTVKPPYYNIIFKFDNGTELYAVSSSNPHILKSVEAKQRLLRIDV